VSNPAQVINPPNTLRAKVGGGFGAIDARAIAKAEEALAAMAGQFSQWLQDELDKLEAARAAIKAQGLTAETAEQLYFRAHDLKGLGGTYQYPLVTRIAGSLCKLLDDAHIDAIKAVVRDRIQTDEHPVGKALVEALEARTAEHLS
jgi:chemotaxis protein histidine kinase CheA